MTTFSKSVILKNWDLSARRKKRFTPKKGINVAWKLIDRQNGECYATFYGSDKPNHANEAIYKNDINDQLANLSKNILSDRARNVRKPQYNIIGSRRELIR